MFKQFDVYSCFVARVYRLVFDSVSAHDSERAITVSIKVVNGERQTKGPPSSFAAVRQSHLVCFCLLTNSKM